MRTTGSDEADERKSTQLDSIQMFNCSSMPWAFFKIKAPHKVMSGSRERGGDPVPSSYTKVKVGRMPWAFFKIKEPHKVRFFYSVTAVGFEPTTN